MFPDFSVMFLKLRDVTIDITTKTDIITNVTSEITTCESEGHHESE